MKQAKPSRTQILFEALEGRELFSAAAITSGNLQNDVYTPTYDLTVLPDASDTTTSVKLTGTSFGTAGSWNNSGNTYAKALDGDPNTYFDAPQADNSFVGLDLGTAQVITSVRFAPRSGLAWRMTGGKFQGSNDNATWTDLATLTTQPAEGYSILNISNANAFRYVRYLSPAGGWGDVAEVEFYGGGNSAAQSTGSTTPGKLTGTSFGTAGSWGNSGNTFANVFDGNTSSFFDSNQANGAVAGLDLGSVKMISSISYYPRTGLGLRMTGGVFQGSNDNSIWTPLATISKQPTDGQYTSIVISDTTAYRYVRYVSPNGGYGNVAEIAFYGTTPAGTGTTGTPTEGTTTGSTGTTTGSTGTTSGSTGSNTGPVAGAPQAVVTLMENSIMAGASVQANGLNTVLNSGSPIDATYNWNFGDPNGTYNTLTGFNAAHIYANAGTYTVTLTVTDNQGRTNTATATVTVAADTRKKIYVDSINGSDSNNGLTPGTAVKTANKAFAMVGDNTEVLFNRGGTYPVTTSLNATYKNLLVATYGSGAKPVLTWVGGTQNWWEMISGSATASQDVMIRDLVLDGGPNKVTGIAPRGVNFAVVDCEFRNFEISINCAGNPTGLLVQDNAQAANAGVTDYWLWLQGTDAVVLGNNVGPGGMYAIRTSGGTGETIYRALFAYNNLSNADRSNLRVQKGGYVYVTNNTFMSSGVEFGPLGSTDGLNDPNWATAHTSYVVFENNSVDLVGTDKYVRLSAGLEHIQVRNNVIEHDSTGEAIGIEGFDPMFNRIVADATIANNTILDNAKVGMGIQVLGPEHGAEISLLNNLFVAPNLVASAATGSVDVWINDIASIKADSGNIWAAVKTDGSAGLLGYVYVAGGSATGFVTPTIWEGLANVNGDVFSNVTLGSTYQATMNGVTAGSSLKKS